LHLKESEAIMKKHPKPNCARQNGQPAPETTLTLEELRHERQTLKQELLALDEHLESLFDSLTQSMLPAATATAPAAPGTPAAEVAA
jgi:hypothetical protein